jgi:hypothetical protein
MKWTSVLVVPQLLVISQNCGLIYCTSKRANKVSKSKKFKIEGHIFRGLEIFKFFFVLMRVHMAHVTPFSRKIYINSINRMTVTEETESKIPNDKMKQP